MNLRKKREISILIGLIITGSTLLLAVNVRSLPLSTQAISTESIYMIVQRGAGIVDGSSTDAGHEGQIDIYQFSHNIYASASSAAAPGVVTHTPLTVIKLIDDASPFLWEILTIGEILPRVQFLFYSTGSVFYYNITLQSGQVISILSDADIGFHYEMVSFIYDKIYWTDEINGITKSSTW